MLEATDLSKSYSVAVAPHPLDLRTEPEEVSCFLGANGAGKATTINLFLNAIPPARGMARVGGLGPVQQALESKRRLTRIPDQVMLYESLAGIESLERFGSLAAGPTRGRN